MTQKVTGSPATAAFLRAALKQFAATLHRQTEQHTGVVDVFANAIRELTLDLQKTRARSRAIEARLEAAENRIEHLESVVAALTRQGWLQ